VRVSDENARLFLTQLLPSGLIYKNSIMTTRIEKLIPKEEKSRDASPVRSEKKERSAVLFMIGENSDDCVVYVIPPSELSPEMFEVLEFWSTQSNINENHHGEGDDDTPEHLVDMEKKCYKLLFGEPWTDSKLSPPPAWEKFLQKGYYFRCSNPYASEIFKISTFS
jgi:hypothetical protein